LTTEKDVLANLIKDIYNKIHRFVKTYQFYDVLSEFYVEFLRKSNSDKGLGIVLTPNHITELFNLLTGTNKNSIVLDNCTGTSGFLISAMSIMVKDCNGNIEKEKSIKEKQLIGIEQQDDIFALACSNMYLHGDGKTNLISDTCFNEKTMERVKAFKPTIGLLNPPYKANKKKDTEELEFVLNNLECLVEGGKCASIVPMQCALSVNGKILELKKKLLTHHTLEAVMSMPDELFFNSNVGVVSCIMIFTAHKPHPHNKETYFGYWKNDGFVKRKEKGRIDAFKRWEGIRESWIESYMNKKSVAGISVMKNVSANNEWCAEAYMETDYSKLSKELFEDTTLQYITYLLGNKQIFKVVVTPKENNELELNTKNWKSFKIKSEELFLVKGSKTVPLLELEEYGKGKYPFVTTQATNNGVAGFYAHYTEQGNVLTIDSAVIGYCSYQALDFSASDHVEKLIPNFTLNKYIAMFLTTVINQEQYRYNYGRKAAHIRLNTASIKLPTKNNKPDFEFMEKYIKSLPYSASL
jgi:type I restriction-modification system DNA methylase subunit